MTTETSLTDSALRAWKQNIDRATKLFGGLSEEQLLQEIAPRKNRLIYLWGHLTAVNDALIPLLGFGKRLHPELDAMFLSNPDRFPARMLSGKELRQIGDEINELLWTAFSALSASEWVRKHASVPEDDFAREPHRNRFAVLLSRTEHIAYHLGQATLAEHAKQTASA
jgi:DinB superfamily